MYMGTPMDFFKREDSENYYYYCKYCGENHYDRDESKECWGCHEKIGTDNILVKTKYPSEYYNSKAKEVDAFYRRYLNDTIPKPLYYYLRYNIHEYDVHNTENNFTRHYKHSILTHHIIKEQIYNTEYFNRHDRKSCHQIRIAPYVFLRRETLLEMCVKCGETSSDTVGDIEYFFDSFKFKKRGIPMPAQRNYRKCNKCGTKWVDKWWDYDVELQKKQ